MEPSWNFFLMIILFGSLHYARGVELRVFHRTLAKYTVISLDNDPNPEQLLNAPGFSLERETIIYTHGILQSITDNSGLIVIQTYLDGRKTNVIGMDWSREVSVPVLGVAALPKAVINVSIVGRKLADFIVKLVKAGLSLARLHLIGISVGSHCMGMAGDYVKAELNESIARITGLDPFRLFFDGISILNIFIDLDSTRRINSNDAEYVDIYHADPGAVGSAESLGTIDIWVNCNYTVQPGCENAALTNVGLFTPQDLCSHLLATKFFADGVRQSTEFVATSAPNCEARSRGEGTGDTVYLGDNINKTARGNYYININTDTPEYQTTAAAEENNDLQQRQLDLRSLLPL